MNNAFTFFFLIKEDITTRDDCILNINLKHTF